MNSFIARSFCDIIQIPTCETTQRIGRETGELPLPFNVKAMQTLPNSPTKSQTCSPSKLGSLLSLCCPGTRCHDICCEKGQGQAGSIWKDCLGSPPSAAKVCSQSWRHLLFTDVLSRSYCLQSPSLHLAQWRLSDTSEVVCLDDALYGWGTWDAVMHCSLEHLKPTEKNDKQFMPYYIIICSFILGSYWVDFSLE